MRKYTEVASAKRCEMEEKAKLNERAEYTKILNSKLEELGVASPYELTTEEREYLFSVVERKMEKLFNNNL